MGVLLFLAVWAACAFAGLLLMLAGLSLFDQGGFIGNGLAGAGLMWLGSIPFWPFLALWRVFRTSAVAPAAAEVIGKEGRPPLS